MNLAPGDRALVLRDSIPKYRGTVVLVLAGPEPGLFREWGTQRLVAGNAYYCELFDGVRGYYFRHELLRLPPDDEACRLFRETDQPRQVEA